jgi:hypothetical protein
MQGYDECETGQASKIRRGGEVGSLLLQPYIARGCSIRACGALSVVGRQVFTGRAHHRNIALLVRTHAKISLSWWWVRGAGGRYE